MLKDDQVSEGWAAFFQLASLSVLCFLKGLQAGERRAHCQGGQFYTLCSDSQKFYVTATAAKDFKKWGDRTRLQYFNEVHSSLFFNILTVVNDTIILLKYFHPKQYYNSTKSVVPLSDSHADAASCPFQNAKAPFLPHCKLRQSHTPSVFHQRASVNFSQSFVFLLYSFWTLSSPPPLPFHLGPSVSPWLVHAGMSLPCNHSCAVWIHPCQLWNKGWLAVSWLQAQGRGRAGKTQESRAADATTATALCPSSSWCGAGWELGNYQVLSPFQGIQTQTSSSLSSAEGVLQAPSIVREEGDQLLQRVKILPCNRLQRCPVRCRVAEHGLWAQASAARLW